jgi:prevent-host-death family protein
MTSDERAPSKPGGMCSPNAVGTFQDLASAKRAAAEGPVFVTDRGKPSLVLVSYNDWALLAGKGRTIADALTGSREAADLTFDVASDRSVSISAEFE